MKLTWFYKYHLNTYNQKALTLKAPIIDQFRILWLVIIFNIQEKTAYKLPISNAVFSFDFWYNVWGPPDLYQTSQSFYLMSSWEKNASISTEGGWLTRCTTSSSNSRTVCWSLCLAVPDVISKFTSLRSMPIDFGMKSSNKLITKSRLSPFSSLKGEDLKSRELRDDESRDTQNFYGSWCPPWLRK